MEDNMYDVPIYMSEVAIGMSSDNSELRARELMKVDLQHAVRLMLS